MKLRSLILATIFAISAPLHAQLNQSGGNGWIYNSSNLQEQRNGTTAQSVYIYNTYTSSTNFEGLNIGAGISPGGANSFSIYATKGSGGGSARTLYLAGDGVIAIYNPAGTVWQWNTSGHLLAGTDNTYDIGASGATRPRVVYGVTVTSGTTSTVSITTANLNFRGNSVLLDGTPTCSGNGCAVTANSVNSAGGVTTTTTGAVDITITFSANFQHAPKCMANNDTTGNLLRSTTEAVGSFHLQGVTVAGDMLDWVCIGN